MTMASFWACKRRQHPLPVSCSPPAQSRSHSPPSLHASVQLSPCLHRLCPCPQGTDPHPCASQSGLFLAGAPCNSFCWQMLLLTHGDLSQEPHTRSVPCTPSVSYRCVSRVSLSYLATLLSRMTVEPTSCQTHTLPGVRMSLLFLELPHKTQKSSSNPAALGESCFPYLPELQAPHQCKQRDRQHGQKTQTSVYMTCHHPRSNKTLSTNDAIVQS